MATVVGSLMMRMTVKAGDDGDVFGSLALGLIEIDWDGDNSVIDGDAEVGLGCLLHFAFI